MSPQRIQRKRVKGWRKPDGAVIVTRPSRWGNPYKIGDLVSDQVPYAPALPYDGSLSLGVHTTSVRGEPRTYQVWRVQSRAEAVALFREWIRYHDDEFPLDRIQGELGGRDLCCWCPLPGPGRPDICHAAVLLALANPGLPDPSRYPTGAKPFGLPYRVWRPTREVSTSGGVL